MARTRIDPGADGSSARPRKPVVVVGSAWRWLEMLGVIALAGVVGQAILATLIYLTPMLRARSTGARELVRQRLEVGARTRAA